MTGHETLMRHREARLGIALFGLMLPNAAVINCFPLLFGVLIDGSGMTPVAAGSLFSMELFTGAVVALFLGNRCLSLDLRLLAIVGSLVVALADLASAFIATDSLALLRAIAGLGAGTVTLASGRIVARSTGPSRLASLVAVAVAIVGAALALGAGLVMARHGRVGGYLYLSAVGLIATAFAACAPSGRGVPGLSGAIMRKPRSGAAPAMVAAAFFAFLGAGAVWNGAERIGVAAGLSRTVITGTISTTSLVGILGALAAVAAARLDRAFPLAAAGCALLCTASAMLSLATDLTWYATAMAVVSLAFIFVTPFLLAAAVSIDRSGALAGAVQGAQLLAGAGAPLIAGVLISGGSVAPLAIFAAASAPLALFALAIAARWRRVRPVPTVRETA